MTDRYTKTMLTIIALCLVWICVRDTAPPAYAQGGTIDVNISEVGGAPIRCTIPLCGTTISHGLPVYSTDD